MLLLWLWQFISRLVRARKTRITTNGKHLGKKSEIEPLNNQIDPERKHGGRECEPGLHDYRLQL